MNLDLGDTRQIIKACKEYGCLRNQAAYLLATAYHETAHTMKPVTEYGSQKYLRSKKYWPWIGRGYVQVTWKDNYIKLKNATGVDVISDPDKALDPEVAAIALVNGTMEGWWTGKPLTKYVTLQKSNFYQARRTVNGLDKAQQIAEYAKQYDESLLKEGYGVVEDVPVPEAKPQTQKNLLTSKEILAGGGSILTGLGAFAGGVHPVAQVLLVAGLIGFGAFIIWNRLKARKDGER